jgi:hypothetical protein
MLPGIGVAPVDVKKDSNDTPYKITTALGQEAVLSRKSSDHSNSSNSDARIQMNGVDGCISSLSQHHGQLSSHFDSIRKGRDNVCSQDGIAMDSFTLRSLWTVYMVLKQHRADSAGNKSEIFFYSCILLRVMCTAMCFFNYFYFPLSGGCKN